jgi:dCTP deaminase
VLADLGAEVIKVEAPRARNAAQTAPAPPVEGEPDHPWNRVPFFNDLHRGKRLLSLDLSGVDGSRLVGYRAKKNSQLVDLSRIDHYEAEEFWEPVTADRRRRIVLEPEEFYLLLSREGVSVPPDLAAEMTAYDPTSGELRTHYAGFFDPGFGYRPDVGGPGSRAALEVRAHDVPFMVEHGQRVCTLTYERMLEVPDVLYGATSSHYQFQTGALSKHFRARR